MRWMGQLIHNRLAAILICGVFIGCVGEAPPDRAALTPRDGIVVIEMTDDMAFSPGVTTAAVDDTIIWVNRGDLPHTTTARSDFLPLEQLPSDAESWDSGLMERSNEFRMVVRAEGAYRYVCTLHQAAGMVAELRVE